VLGGVILLGFDEALRFAEELRPGIYGLMLICVMLFCPQGLERIFLPIADKLRSAKEPRASAAEPRR
jgi:branched-chain amino acid transport system permease protein